MQHLTIPATWPATPSSNLDTGRSVMDASEKPVIQFAEALTALRANDNRASPQPDNKTDGAPVEEAGHEEGTAEGEDIPTLQSETLKPSTDEIGIDIDVEGHILGAPENVRRLSQKPRLESELGAPHTKSLPADPAQQSKTHEGGEKQPLERQPVAHGPSTSGAAALGDSARPNDSFAALTTIDSGPLGKGQISAFEKAAQDVPISLPANPGLAAQNRFTATALSGAPASPDVGRGAVNADTLRSGAGPFLTVSDGDVPTRRGIGAAEGTEVGAPKSATVPPVGASALEMPNHGKYSDPSLTTAAVQELAPQRSNGPYTVPDQAEGRSVTIKSTPSLTMAQVSGAVPQLSAASMAVDSLDSTLGLPIELGSAFDTATGPMSSSVRHVLGAQPVAVVQSAAQQMAVAVRSSQGGVTELVLNPAELGRVELRLATNDTGVTIHIAIERLETQDLIRRHLESLAAEFRQMGFRDVDFEFRDRRHQHGQSPDASLVDPPTGEAIEAATDEVPNSAALLKSGLDLRL